MAPRAIWSIGCGQLVNWGVLYYAFGVLLLPVERTLNAPRWLVAGAFSLGLLVSAIAAPAVGRLADRGQGPAVMQAGGYIAAGLLIAWALLPTIGMTYVVWAGLGLCMAAILYEPVFAMVGRAYSDADDRLRAIASITVMGRAGEYGISPWDLVSRRAPGMARGCDGVGDHHGHLDADRQPPVVSRRHVLDVRLA